MEKGLFEWALKREREREVFQELSLFNLSWFPHAENKQRSSPRTTSLPQGEVG